MTVGELIEQLRALDSELLVVLSTDQEGNSFNPLAQVDGENNGYEEREVHLLRLTDELAARGYTDEDVFPDAVPAVVLVMPQEKFLVAPGYGTYGKILCYESEYDTNPGGKPFGGWYILSCKGNAGTHNFRYPKSKEWSYANL